MSNSDLAATRQSYAEELRHVAHIRSPRVVQAFATVPREHFAGAGPWRLISPMTQAGYWTTDDDDPAHLYHDVLIAIDESRRLNNGQPSLWAFVFDQLDLKPGEHVVHIGIGAGYYTGVLADIVGQDGQVTAVEIDTGLAERARANLASSWPNTTVLAADGFTFRPERPADVIIVNAGVTHLSLTWLDALAEHGRLLVPLTDAHRWGAFLQIVRGGDRYAASHVCRVGIIECVGGRDSEAEARLTKALQHSQAAPPVKSLRRSPDEPDDTCWLAGEGWWLSTAEP